MMIDLDVATLRAAVSAIFGFAALFFAIAARVHTDEPALRSWSLANALCAFANLIVLSQKVHHSAASLLLVGAVYVLGNVFNWVGLRQLFNAPMPWQASRILAVVGALMVMGLSAAGLLPPIQGLRYLLWFVPGLLAVAWAIDLLRLTMAQRTPIVWFLAGMSALNGLAFISSGVYGLFIDILGGDPAHRITFFTIALAMLLPGTLAINWGSMMMFGVKMREEMIRLASIDSLTGLLNRRAFKAAAEKALADAHAEGGTCGLLVLDLDHFKSINDTYGHTGGDDVLRSFSALLLDRSRSDDLIGRVGGEEFCVLLPRAGVEASLAYAERIRQATMSQEMPCDGTQVHITTSVGVAVMTPGETIDSLFTRADRALFVSKTEGRNRITMASTEVIERRQQDRRPAPAQVAASRPGATA